MSNYQDAPGLFALEERRTDISQRLYYYLMRLPTAQEIDRFLELEQKVDVQGEAAVLAAWIREHQGGQRLPTNEVQAVGYCVNLRVERRRAS